MLDSPSSRAAVVLLFAASGCAARETPAAPPPARLEPASTATAPAPSATAPAVPFPVAWDCASAPPRTAIDTPIPEVFTSPSESASFTRAQAEALRVELALPTMTVPVRAMLALDHFPPQSADAEQPLRSLLTEWDPLVAGSHRLVAFWLDERGLPLADGAGKPLVRTRHFLIEAAAPLPAANWLLVSPAGTLNGTKAPPVGHPFGFSLLALDGAETPLTLEVSRSGERHSAAVTPGDCALAIAESGDYRFEIVAPSGERLARTITVNRDLERP